MKKIGGRFAKGLPDESVQSEEEIAPLQTSINIQLLLDDDDDDNHQQ